jgi:hypothetical protein
MRLSSPAAAPALAVTFVSSLTALALAACVREGPPPVAAVEVAIGDLPEGGTSAPLAAPPPARADHRCTARLHALPIKTGSGCTLDERISRGTGTLVYPCAGDGPVEAVFGEHRFEGSINGGAMVLALTTELDWEDGCHWETRQGLRSSWRRDRDRDRDADEAPTSRPKLAWTYTERPVIGTGCYGSCKATADIEVFEEPSP